jgi:2'-5' RNA ligase
MEKRHRVFIAINLPDDIKRELIKRQEKFKNKFIFNGEDGENFDLAKWTEKDNLHITLEFLGYLTDQEIADTCKITKEIAKNHESFSINLNKIEYGPKNKPFPSMIWASGEKSKEVSLLKNNLQNALLESVNFKPESREFTPHITLARLKEWQLKTINSEEQPEVSEDINLLFTVESIEVMESVMKKGGPTYEILESCELKI